MMLAVCIKEVVILQIDQTEDLTIDNPQTTPTMEDDKKRIKGRVFKIEVWECYNFGVKLK